MKKTLTVYKASAGSGKTFTLVTQYIKLLVLNPTCYRNILAVTFTNKATEEMKTRIITHLYGIWKGLPDSKQYLQKTIQETQLPAATIQERLLLKNGTKRAFSSLSSEASMPSHKSRDGDLR